MANDYPDGLQVIHEADLTEAGSGGRSGEMRRASAVEVGGVWVGTSVLAQGYLSAWHHHGDQNTVVYIVTGSFKFIVGESREVYTGQPGDLVVIPPWMPHAEDNSQGEEDSLCLVVRTGTPPIVVNIAE